MKIEELLYELHELYKEQYALERQIAEIQQQLKDWAGMNEEIKQKINNLNKPK